MSHKSFKEIIKEQELFEMSPKNIESLNSSNLSKEANAYYRKNKSKFKPTDTEYLYKSGDGYNGYYMFVRNDVVEYFVNYKMISSNKFFGRMSRQILVHRNAHSVLSAGIPKKVFFDYLLPTFGTIITDTQQTADGKRFWEYAIAEALDNSEKYSVYIFDRNKGVKTKIETREEFDDLSGTVWGDEKCFESMLVVITLNRV